jgi:hypothetical protein
MSIHQQYLQPTSLPVSARYTTKAMLQGHGQITKRYVHRNSTSNAINLDGNIFYTATATNNASINTATGVSSSSYGYASAMPIALPVSMPSASSIAASAIPAVSTMDAPQSSSTSSSSSMDSPMLSQASTTAAPVSSTTQVPVPTLAAVPTPGQELHFCLPPTFPSSYRSYMPLSVYTRQKDVLSASIPSRGGSSVPLEDDPMVKVADRLKIYHLSATASNADTIASSSLNSTVGSSSNIGSSPTGSNSGWYIYVELI